LSSRSSMFPNKSENYNMMSDIFLVSVIWQWAPRYVPCVNISHMRVFLIAK